MYFYYPSKNGFIGFFKVDKFFKFPNLSRAYSKNSVRSEKSFLFAENVHKNRKMGKSVKTVNLLSSIINVIKFPRGLKSIPFDNWFEEASICLTLTPFPI